MRDPSLKRLTAGILMGLLLPGLAWGLVAIVQFGTVPPLLHKKSADPAWIAAAQLSASQAQAAIPDVRKKQFLQAYGKLSLTFEPNQGQTDRRVNFLARGRGYTLFLTPTEAVLVFGKPNARETQPRMGPVPATAEPETAPAAAPTVLRMQLLDANLHPRMVGLDELPGKSNYFIGNDPKAWHTNVPNYAKARYEDVYPGVDLVYYGNQRQLEYDFVVTPGADPKAIRLGFKGANNVSLGAEGDLILSTADGELRLHKPLIYQKINGVKHTIAGRYLLKGKHRVGFQVANYDANTPLVIDPVLSYSTYLGGSSNDEGTGIAVDACGNAYVTGRTLSLDFPTAPTGSPLDGSLGGAQDAFVTKLNTTVAGAASLVYSTYLGGDNADIGRGIAVDGSGNAYVVGSTQSINFPTAPSGSPLDGSLGGAQDAFVTKLNPAGSALLYSTYLGGDNNEDEGLGIAVDATGNAYVTGRTLSLDFPTAPTGSPLDGSLGGAQDAFVAKISGTTTDADLCITKTDSPDPVLVTRDLTYTLTVTNIGPGDATGVVATDSLASSVVFLSSSPSQGTCSVTSNTVTCTLGTLLSNASATITILINPTVVGTLSNSASVISGSTDPNLSNNSATASTTVSATPPPGSGVDGCFIATAAFGSPLAAEVEILRAFRDRYLLPHTAGQWAVALYYRLSPPLAEVIRQHEPLRATARVALWPVVWWADLALTWPVLALSLGGGALVTGPLLLYILLRARRARSAGRARRTIR